MVKVVLQARRAARGCCCERGASRARGGAAGQQPPAAAATGRSAGGPAHLELVVLGQAAGRGRERSGQRCCRPGAAGGGPDPGGGLTIGGCSAGSAAGPPAWPAECRPSLRPLRGSRLWGARAARRPVAAELLPGERRVERGRRSSDVAQRGRGSMGRAMEAAAAAGCSWVAGCVCVRAVQCGAMVFSLAPRTAAPRLPRPAPACQRWTARRAACYISHPPPPAQRADHPPAAQGPPPPAHAEPQANRRRPAIAARARARDSAGPGCIAVGLR